MKKYLSKAYLAAFILLFIAPTLLFALLKPYLDSTNYEQRKTAQMPTLSLQTLEDFPQQFEAFYNDNLPFRTQLVKANSQLFLKVLKQSPIDKVILGKDGWLFYNPRGSDGDPIADYRGVRTLSEEQLAKIAETLIGIRDSLREQGKEFVFMLAPNKECLYGNDFLPDDIANGNTYSIGDQVVEYLQAHTDLTVVYPKKAILRAMENDPDNLYYYKTDTHWNELGSYIGSVELLKALGITMPELSELDIEYTEGFAGDLAKMIGLRSDFAYDRIYTLRGYAEEDAVLVYETTGPDEIHQFATTNADPRSILVIRDSFSINMFPYLASQFQTATFLSRGNDTFSNLSERTEDIVVAQFVERYWDYMLYYYDN